MIKVIYEYDNLAMKIFHFILFYVKNNSLCNVTTCRSCHLEAELFYMNLLKCNLFLLKNIITNIIHVNLGILIRLPYSSYSSNGILFIQGDRYLVLLLILFVKGCRYVIDHVCLGLEISNFLCWLMFHED